jgi:hypothetical protein
MTTQFDYGDGRTAWKPVIFPEARRVADIFAAAKLANGMPPADSDFRYVSGTRGGAFCGHMGGETYIVVRKGTNELFCLGGTSNVFTSTWGQPVAGIVDSVSSRMISEMGSMETVERTDGRLLVLARDVHQIGQRYVALLDAGENLESLFNESDMQRMADYRAKKATVASCINEQRVNLEMAERLGIRVEYR